MCLIVAHGENWEVAASHAVDGMVKKIISENGGTKDSVQENGTFELHYTPANKNDKAFTVAIPTRHGDQGHRNMGNNGEHDTVNHLNTNGDMHQSNHTIMSVF